MVSVMSTMYPVLGLEQNNPYTGSLEEDKGLDIH